MSSSDAVQAKIKESYKQSRRDDDLNQPLSVQPWGSDDLKRRYWLIEGLDDTHFRLYRESNPALKTNTWWSVAGTIDELKAVADKLEKDRSQQSKRLSEKIRLAIPRFEGSEEVRWFVSQLLSFTETMGLETQTPRLSPGPESCFLSARAWFLPLRGPHSWKKIEVHLL